MNMQVANRGKKKIGQELELKVYSLLDVAGFVLSGFHACMTLCYIHARSLC